MNFSLILLRKLKIFALLLALIVACAPRAAFAGSSYEDQIAGFMSATLETIITGEFAGLSPSNADAAQNRPVCKPRDYEDLRAAAKDRAALDAFRRRCGLVEVTIDNTHVHSIAYLPQGYCETLKAAFERAMIEEVYGTKGDNVTIEYKGSRFQITGYGNVARQAKIQATCRDGGSLRVSAPKKSVKFF